MGVLKSDYPMATITIHRVQKDWLAKQKGINFSGLVQQMLTEVIKVQDPVFYSIHVAELDDSTIQRKEMMQQIAKRSIRTNT